MANWLFKSEPDTYSYDDLIRDGSTVWDGVANSLAKKHLRAVRPGDRVWFYHTGGIRAIVGEATIVGLPSDIEGEVTVAIAPVRKLAEPIALASIRASAKLADWDLVRLPRLSVMPVPDEVWAILQARSASEVEVRPR